MKINGVRASKKTYYSPKLNIYGEIRELTQAANASPQESDHDVCSPGSPLIWNRSGIPTCP